MKQKGYMLLVGMVCLFSSSPKEIFASHASGMDIFYRWTTGSSYEVTIVYYNYCGGVGAPTSFSLRSTANSISKDYTTNISRLPTSGTGVPPLEPSNMYNCTDASLCYQEYVYRGIWTAQGSADDWILSTSLCCRPGGTFAPANIPYGTLWSEAGLNNLDFPDAQAQNWSPLWHNRRPNHPGYTTDTVINYLMRTLCAGNYYTLDQSVREYQGDSVSYAFDYPKNNGGVNYTFIPPFHINMPFPTSNNQNIAINPRTGIIPVIPGNPTGTGVYVMSIKATEWRKLTITSGGASYQVPKKIGFIRRDMTIWIDGASTCRKDSAHPKDITLTNGGGDTVLDVYFHTGISGDPNSQVRCASISPDGSEFRILDSSNYVAPYDSTVRSIGINQATWNCNAGLTDKVTLYLAEPLRCQEYTVMLKTGTDLDVLESECGFLEPEWSTGLLTVTKDVQVNIDTNKAYLTYCLPTNVPFPKLLASSTDSASFPLTFYWTFNGDTVQGQDINSIHATQPGEYKVLVRDPLNCVGDDKITIFHDTYPEFNWEAPLYCDRYGETPGLPDAIWVPEDSTVIKWEWFIDPLGKVGEGDTLKVPQLIDNEWYKLRGTKPKIDPRADRGCAYEYEFYYGRDSFPPQAPLWVKFLEDEVSICVSDNDTAWLTVWDDGIRDKYAPWDVQWYYYLTPVPGQQLSRMVTDTGWYGVHIEDSLGCWGRDTIIVTKDVRIDGPEIPCTVNGGIATFAFNWPLGTPVEGNEVSYDGGLTWYPASNGNTHTVPNIQQQKVILGRGLVPTACEYTDISNSVECPDQVFPPNVITPNGDGLNDVFEVRGLELFERSEVEIFDRWGNVVFSSDNYANDWDGADQPEGTYYYILKVDDPDNTVHKGVITLIR